VQDFKCHKLVLSACSPIFKTMFFSHFKEAQMGPDEPIKLDKIDPQVFESAMRWAIILHIQLSVLS
jgi:BTB/POZ domain